MPKVSVIQTCYNHEKYIGEALDSILAQTYQDFEVIVVNDGSADRSGEIIESCSQQHPSKVIYIEQINQGPEGAMNSGLSRASGEYLALIAGDDTWFPTKLEKQVQLLDRDKEKRIGLVYTYGNQPNEDPTRTRLPVRALGIRGQVFKRLFQSVWFIASSIMIPRFVFDDVGLFNRKYTFCGDYELMLRIAAASYEFDYVPELLVNRRIHPDNLSRHQLESYVNTREMILNITSRYKNLVELYNIDVDFRLAKHDQELVRHYFIQGDLLKVRQILIPIIRKYPRLALRPLRNLAYLGMSFLPKAWVRQLGKASFLSDLFLAK